jgi:hypothetical protein
MWLVNVLALASGIAFSLLQNPASSEQNPSPQKSAPSALQASPVAKPEQPAPPASAVASTQPVITIHGLCGDGAHTGGENACSKVISRKEFESLMDALNPGGQPISPAGRQNLAQAYVEALAFADAARKAGTQETEEFRQVMFWVRLRTIADLYRRNLQEQYRTPSPEEIDSYYQQHLASFERVRLLRILVPRENFAGADKSGFDQKALAAAQAAHTRAVNGEAPEQIQKDVYAGLGLERPPATDLGTFGRTDFIEKESTDVFSLQPGEVSPLETELKSYVIYKVVGKETLTEAQVKAEIVREISQQKYRDAIKSALDSAPADFNEQYFGPMAPKPPLEAPPVPRRPAR